MKNKKLFIIIVTTILIFVLFLLYAFSQQKPASEKTHDIDKLMDKGYWLFHHRDFDEAILYFDHVLSVDNNNKRASILKAGCLLMLKKDDEAWKAYGGNILQDFHIYLTTILTFISKGNLHIDIIFKDGDFQRYKRGITICNAILKLNPADSIYNDINRLKKRYQNDYINLINRWN